MKLLRSLILLALTCLYHIHALPEPQLNEESKYGDFHPSDIITRDVAIIGGGSGGTYTAIRLRQLGKSVVVVEKEAVMGGHTNTYTVPRSGQKIDYGVVVFHNTSIVRDYFGHFNIPLAPADFGTPNTTKFVDLSSGKEVSGYLSKYPYLATGFNLPSPVPVELLLPFHEFVEKHSLSALVQTVETIGQGYADIINQPTLYAMKLLSLDLVRNLQTGFIATARHNNHELYDAAAKELTAAKSLLLSSCVLSVTRSPSSPYSRIIVQTPTGKKLILACKIVVAFSPRLSNFQGWDLDHKEKSTFGTFTNEAYWTGLLTNHGIPDSYHIVNVGASTPFNLPSLPGIYGLSPTAQSGLLDVKYASSYEQSDAQVQENILAALERLKLPNVTLTPAKANFAAFNAHVPFFEHVSADEIQGGFYERANALQGYRETYYTGAAWEAHDSSAIWAFTERLLKEIV